MRYIIGSLAVIAAIIALTVINSCYMSSLTAEVLSYLDTAMAHDPQEQEEVVRAAQTLDQYWDDKQCYLESVVLHEELEAVSTTISNFVSAAECRDYDDFAANGRLLRVQLEHLARLERLRLGNIL